MRTGKWDLLSLMFTQNEDLIVETAFLHYPEKAGQPRYPTWDVIEEMLNTGHSWLNALHICGTQAFLEFITPYNKDELHPRYYPFDRIQLNTEWTSELYQAFQAYIYEVDPRPRPYIILQYNRDNAKIFKEHGMFGCEEGVQYLFDESRGTGKPADPEDWKKDKPKDADIGYAGGISYENMWEVMHRVHRWRPKEFNNSWIDMESSLRNSIDDEMNIYKVMQTICEYYDIMDRYEHGCTLP